MKGSHKGPLNIKTTPIVNEKIKELLNKYTYAILYIKNNKPSIAGVNNIDTLHYTIHWLDGDISIFVDNKDLWDLFNCTICDPMDKTT